MDKDKREGWLRELKVGDEVAIECGNYGYRDYYIKNIDKISPTGRITIKSTVYDHTGREMGKAGTWSKKNSLEPITQDIKDFVRRKELLEKVTKTKWDKISLEKLENIAKTLELD